MVLFVVERHVTKETSTEISFWRRYKTVDFVLRVVAACAFFLSLFFFCSFDTVSRVLIFRGLGQYVSFHLLFLHYDLNKLIFMSRKKKRRTENEFNS